SNAGQWRDQFPGYTLIAFDPRGTGRSGVLRCPELQADPSASPAREQALVAKCATEIGSSRSFYSTRDHADDIDAVRQALGVDKVSLWGTSYGTQLSVAYALTYPTHVARLLLDSVAARLPPAVHAALHGQTRPLLRLVELDRETSVTSTKELSMGLLAATVCDDGPFPWQPETPLSQRQALLDAARNGLAPGATGPFGKWATDI